MLGSTGSASFGISSWGLVGVVGNVGQGKRSVGGGFALTRSSNTTAAASTTTTTTTASASLLAINSLLLLILVWLAGELDRDLAFEDVLAREFVDGLVCFWGRLQVDKGITNGTVGARVDRNRGGLAVDVRLVLDQADRLAYTS